MISIIERVVKFPSSIVPRRDNHGGLIRAFESARLAYIRTIVRFAGGHVTSGCSAVHLAVKPPRRIHKAPAFSVAHPLPLHLQLRRGKKKKSPLPPPGEEMHASRNAAPTTAQGEPLLALHPTYSAAISSIHDPNCTVAAGNIVGPRLLPR